MTITRFDADCHVGKENRRIGNNGFETYHRRPRNEGDYGEYN